jgi:hypothetical protein
VAPESSKAGISALLFGTWRKTRIDIDCQFDKYIRSELSALAKADVARLVENPTPLLCSGASLFRPSVRWSSY